MLNNKGSYLLAVLAITAGIGLSVIAVRAEVANTTQSDISTTNAPNLIKGVENTVSRGVAGAVNAIDGTTLTIQAGTSQNIYTVDAAKATAKNGGTVIKVADIAVGDQIAVLGTVTGMNVVATSISVSNNAEKDKKPGDDQQIMNGNLIKVVGATMTVEDNKTVYTVDASGAAIHKGKETNLIPSDIAVGSRVMVRGVVNGTAVTASVVTDLTQAQKLVQQVKNEIKTNGVKAFFGKIGDFFKNLFNKKK